MNKLPLDIQFFSISGGEEELTVTYKTYGYPKVTSVEVKAVSSLPIFIATIPEDWDSIDNYTITKTYYSNQTESILVAVGNSSMSAIDGTATIVIDQIGTVNTREESYAYCGSKCMHPVYTKDNFKTVEYIFTTTSTNQAINNYQVDYPEGFNQNNTFLLSSRFHNGTNWQTVYVTSFGSNPVQYVGTLNATFSSSGVVFNGRLPYMETGTVVTLQFLLMKVDI